MRVQAVVWVMALVLAACATTVSRDEAFSGGSGQSFAFIGVPLDELETHTLTFKRVDLASSTFLGSSFYVKVQPQGSERWRRVPKDRDEAAALHFGGRQVAPGDYALVSHSVYRYLGSMSTEEVNCYALGAAIYRFREGAINIVLIPRFVPGWMQNAFGSPRKAAIDDETLQAQAVKSLAGSPNMTAPRVRAQPIGAARFETDKSNCIASSSFSFTACPG